MQPEATQSVRDRLSRPLSNLRLSVTDRCNLRCAYCMPEEEYGWLPSDEVLTFEEISALVDRFARKESLTPFVTSLRSALENRPC